MRDERIRKSERWENEEEGKKEMEEKERNEGERTKKSAIQDSLAILGFCFKEKNFTEGREWEKERNKGEKEERKK